MQDNNFQPEKKPVIKSRIRIYEDEVHRDDIRDIVEKKLLGIKRDVMDRISKMRA